MLPQLLSYKNSTISYYLFGAGPKPVLCFHGFGEEATLFGFLDYHIGKQFSFISIDLPFHGKTSWRESDFTAEDLLAVLDAIVLKHTRDQRLDGPVTLLGFSLGGRVALSLYQARPSRFIKMVLLAPDGLRVNPWYWLATQTRIGNRLFRATMAHPGWLFGLLKMIEKLGLANASVTRFVKAYIDDREARRLLYNRWTCLRRLKPGLGSIKEYIRKHGTPVRMLYGKYDRIILPARGEQFSHGIEPYCTLELLATGHQVVQEKHADEIVTALLH